MEDVLTDGPDLSEFLSLSKPRTPPCPVGLVLEGLTEEERTLFARACESPQNVITNIALSVWLERRAPTIWGEGGSWQAARSHRSRACTCNE